MGSKFIMVLEDNPDDEALMLRALRKNHVQNEVVIDFVQFVEAVRQLGLYWLALHEAPPL